MPTICRCGKKARFNGRKVDGSFVTDGESILIDNDGFAKSLFCYESVCGDCYVKKILHLKK